MNSFFLPHVDTKKFQGHVGTVLLIAPKSYSNYEGGQLIVHHYDTNNLTKFNVPTSDRHWTIVIIALHIKHEILPITSGVRYVIKFALSANDTNNFPVSFMKPFLPNSIFSNKKIETEELADGGHQNCVNIVNNVMYVVQHSVYDSDEDILYDGPMFHERNDY
jgi:hypothetical protein